MRQDGRLTHWNDERGFGFISGTDGNRYFVHISAIGRIATRPRDGDAVTFLAGAGRDGRREARSVEIAGANPLDREAVRRRGQPAAKSRADWRSAAAVVLVALLAIAIARGAAPLWIAAIYAVAGAFSFALYGADKAAAEAKRWRTSEAALLGVDLCFGIIGGLAAQQVWRHKTRKPPFVAATILLVLVHAMWLGGLAIGLISADKIMALLRSVA